MYLHIFCKWLPQLIGFYSFPTKISINIYFNKRIIDSIKKLIDSSKTALHVRVLVFFILQLDVHVSFLNKWHVYVLECHLKYPFVLF